MQYQTILLADHSCPNCTWFLLLALLGAFLLGLLLGWILWNRYKAMVAEVEAEKARLQAKLNDLEKDHASLRYSYEESQKREGNLSASLRGCEADKGALSGKISRLQGEIDELKLNASTNDDDLEVFGASTGGVDVGGGVLAAGAYNYAALFANDNLQIIEGIGPKIEELLKNAGVSSWAILADTQVHTLKSVLDSAGPSYRMHNPTSWPEQARLASGGHWDELVKYQKFLDTGRETTGDFATPAKIEQAAEKLVGVSYQPDDLKAIEGIGPKTETILKSAGINDWAALAGTEVDKIKEILAAAGSRFQLADPTTWPQQAELAAAGKWKELKEYQDYLEGGRDPATK